MLIHVLYDDNRYDYVKGFQLDRLLEMKKVQRFKRRSGWVIVGVDPIRSQRDPAYLGVERRASRQGRGEPRRTSGETGGLPLLQAFR